MFGRAFGVAVLSVILALSGDALARGGGHGGGHGGGGHGFRGGGGGHHFGGGGGRHFGGHFGGYRGGFARHSIGRAHFGRAHFGGSRFAARPRNFAPMRHAAIAPGNARHALNMLNHPRAMRSGRVLGNPAARMQIAGAAALAGWHGGAFGNGWWRHGNGGYGWVGPLFWPFAYNDLYDYAIWGGYGFWDYGYGDIYTGIFAPYGYDDLAGYFPQQRRYDRGRRSRPLDISQMCGNDSRAVAGMPVDEIADAVRPTEAQRAALADLGNTSMAAAQAIRAACPSQANLTAPGRLAVMQQRIEAMITAAGTIQPKLENFYGLLDDEQKARLNALSQDQRKTAGSDTGSAAQACGGTPPVALEWPSSDIEARVHPDDTQRAKLKVLQDTSARAAETLKANCQTGNALTPPARLAASAKRLEVMLQAVKDVRAALEDFYATLNDEQKAQFEAIGPKRTA